MIFDSGVCMEKMLAYYSFRYLYDSMEALKVDSESSGIMVTKPLPLYIFAAFTYESFLNHAGHFVFKSWDEHLKPKLSPLGKMSFLCEVAGIDLDYGNSPFQTFKSVMELRNELAHAETEFLPYDEIKHHDPANWPKPKWQKIVGNLESKRVIKDLEEIIEIMEKALGLMPVPSLILMEAVEVPDKRV